MADVLKIGYNHVTGYDALGNYDERLLMSSPFTVSDDEEVTSLHANYSAAYSGYYMKIGLYSISGNVRTLLRSGTTPALGRSGEAVAVITSYTLVPGTSYCLAVTQNNTNGYVGVRTTDISGATGSVFFGGTAGVPNYSLPASVTGANTMTSDPALWAEGPQALAPTVSTSAASGVTDTAATFNGNMSAAGTAEVTEQGFYYLAGTTGTPGPSDSVISSTGSFTAGVFSEAPTGLSVGTDYRVVAFATNSVGTATGDVVDFRTIGPAVTTDATTDITSSSATLNGTATDDGGETITERGFYYKDGETGTPTAADSTISSTGSFAVEAYTEELTGLVPGASYRAVAFIKTASWTATGEAVTVLAASEKVVIPGTTGEMETLASPLAPDTTYYARAFATNSEGTEYSEEVEFTTPPENVPAVIFIDGGATAA